MKAGGEAERSSLDPVQRGRPPSDNISEQLKNTIIELVSSESRIDNPDASAQAETASLRAPRWKRIVDVMCILLTSPFWLPLLIIIMAWVKLASPGPVFYRQKRIGYRKNHFMLLKIRTMHIDVETQIHEAYFERLMRSDCAMTKLDLIGDARLIRAGRFLRASGLDELPQIFNVLRGEMSLVGPRPCLPSEFEHYQDWQRERTNALPGLTGYWQVSGKNKTTFSEMIAMDLFYAKNMSFWFDLKILLKTIPVLVMQACDSRRVAPTRPAQESLAQAAPPPENLNRSAER